MKYVRYLSILFYYIVARNLPRSFWPGGNLFSFLRVMSIRLAGGHVGTGCDIEPGIDIGLAPKIRIGNRCQINMDVSLRNVVIGDSVLIAPGCVILDRQHVFTQTEMPIRDQGVAFFKSTVLEDDVWLGQNVIVMPGVTIGRGAIVGSGSVVTHDVPSYAISVGAPARVIRYRKEV